MPNKHDRFESFQLDIETFIKPLNDEQEYLQKLGQSLNIDCILRHLFDLLEVEDFRQLFIDNISSKIDHRWLQSLSKLCMKRYLENDQQIFSSLSSKTNSLIVNKYKKKFISLLKGNFRKEYFRVILNQFEYLNRFKYEQISDQLNANNNLIEKICSSFDSNDQTFDSIKDDSIIHLISTSPQINSRPVYVSYKPIHMVYLRDTLIIRNDHDSRWPSKGLANSFVADLINTKQINIVDETNGKCYDIQTKYIYFSKSCENHVLLPLKLRVAIIDNLTGRYRYGLIGEEPGKNNDYRCLIFFTDDLDNGTASYHLPSDIHVCLDQTYSTHCSEYQSDFLERYFNSYPERMMLRAKEGIIVKVRNSSSSQFLPALVIQIDGSMMQIEFIHNKQRLWIYRGSPLLDQMHNYYSTQNRTMINGLTRQTARQHLSARRTNVPEIICSNEQTNRIKSTRTAEQFLDQTRSSKRVRTTSNEQDSEKLNDIQTTLSSITQIDQNQCEIINQNSTSSIQSINSSKSLNNIQQRSTRSQQNTIHHRIVLNSMFVKLAEKFFENYSHEFHPHECSPLCVVNAEKYFHDLPKTINPFLKPFACQWTVIENVRIKKLADIRLKATGATTMIYCAPCGRKLINQGQVDFYLHMTKSKLTIELFIFDRRVNIKQHYLTDGIILNRDISNGLENVPISVVNEVDKQPNQIEHPSSFTYRVERSPVSGVQMIINEPTMTCCSCTDACLDRSKCACWLKTLKYSELIGDERLKMLKRKNRSQTEILNQIGYRHRRLTRNLPGGIFECNNRCHCQKETCSNRVVQNGIIVQLQLFKTVARGWGVRTLHDLPVGTFISVYSGEIFTSEQADERGKLLGDEYQADLDFFENINNDSEEEHGIHQIDDEYSNLESVKTRRRIDQNDQNSTLNRTIALPDYDGVVYTLDAKLIGNIGRYFNHSCSPNIAVQNIFVDTHDIHFPWIGFFATKMIRAGSELCWDYNYTVGEIAGRRMDCHCGSTECRRRVL